MDSYSDDSDDDALENDYFKKTFVAIILDINEISMIGICCDAIFNLLSSILKTNLTMEKVPFILFFGDKLVVDFGELIPTAYKKLKLLKEKDPIALKDEYDDANHDFVHVLNRTLYKLNTISKTGDRRVIYYVTDKDEPVVGDEKRLSAFNEAEKMNHLNIVFNLLVLKSNNFNMDKFYEEFYKSIPKGDVILTEDGGQLLQQFFSSYRHSISRKVIIPFYMPNFEDSQVPILLEKIIVIKHSKIKCNAKVDRKTSKEVIKKRVVREGSTTALNRSAKIRPPSKSYFPRISLDDEQLQKYKNDAHHVVGLTLVQIIESRAFDKIVCKQSFFVGTSDNDNDRFNCLWYYAQKKQVVLRCLYKSRSNANAYWVELVPRFFKKRMVFLMNFLPTSEQMHYASQDLMSQCTSTELDSSRKNSLSTIVNEMTMKYNPLDFYDFSYRCAVEHLKANILEETEPTVEAPISRHTFESDILDKNINALNSCFRKNRKRKNK